MGAGIPASFFTSASALLASQYQSTPRRSPYRIGIFRHPATFDGSPYRPLDYSLRLATHVMKFSQETAPMASEQAYLKLSATRSAQGI